MGDLQRLHKLHLLKVDDDLHLGRWVIGVTAVKHCVGVAVEKPGEVGLARGVIAPYDAGVVCMLCLKERC